MNTNSKSKSDNDNSLWGRVLYTLIFAVAFGISESVLYLLAIVSLVYRAINGDNHQTMVNFGHSLAQYVKQLADYMTFNTDQTPFPFSPWPANHITDGKLDEPNNTGSEVEKKTEDVQADSHPPTRT